MSTTRILIAEDEMIIAHNLSYRLSGLDYEVPAIAASGEEAIALALEHRPDLILMDIKLEGAMGGIEAAEIVRAQLDVPVIYLTGLADKETLQRAKVTEPFGYLLKPFDIQALSSAIEIALYKHAMERRLRASEQRYRQLVETLQEGVWVLDATGHTTYVNPRMATMLGYGAEEMLGRHLHDFCDAEHRSGAEAMLEERGRGLARAAGQHELVFCHKDGHTVATILETAPFFDEQGRYTGAIAGVIDISARLQAEQQIRLQSAALEATANAIVITDAHGTILWANPAFARLTGYTVEEAVGHNPRLVKSGLHDAGFYQEMWQTILAGRVWHSELVNRRRDGTLYNEEMTITPLRNPAGAISHFVAVKQDITARKQVETELRSAKDAAEAANRAKSTFLSNAGHEFRTPLNAIIGYSEILEEEIAGGGQEEIVDDLKRIQRAGHHLLALIDDVIDLARLEAGQTRLKAETFGIAGLLGEVAALATPLAAQQGNRLVVQGDASLGQMCGDRAKVEQVLMNLLSNASKFTRGGQITLGAERAAGDGAGWVLFRVADTGTGLDPRRLSQLFQPFATVGEAGRGHRASSGLGLALCHYLCRLMGGEIGVVSEPGQGATFAVRLPA